MLTREEFWERTSTDRLDAEYMVDEKLKYLQSATPQTLCQIFHEYRFFIKYYINDLGLLLYKAPFSKFKCMVAEIAAEELGETPDKTHLQLWDNFLTSLGVESNKLEASAHPENIDLLEDLSSLMMTRPFMYGVGLRGMGGECLCQVYLTAAHKHLLKNPYIQSNAHSIDWLFWEIHTGEVDIQHGVLVKAAIDEMIREDPSKITPLAEGYDKGKEVWDQFWTNLYKATDFKEAATA